MRKIKKVIFYVVLFLCHLLPIKRNWVLLTSFTRTYNDNQKPISKKLYEKHPELKQIFIVSPSFNTTGLPKYIKWAKVDSIKHAYYLARAKVLVDGYVGVVYCVKQGKVPKFNKKIKRKNQVNLSTWHGTPLKKLGKDALINKDNTETYCSTDLFLANSNYIKDKMKESFGIEKSIVIGSPRNDILFNQKDKQKVREKLGLPLDKKIVLYAPTYRDAFNGKQILIYMDNEQIKAVNSMLKNKFGGDWAFIYRAHKHAIGLVGGIAFNDTVIDGNKYDEMALYLIACDILITDYSGSLFDYTVTEKPCLLYAPDYEFYRDLSRGLYMELDELPYPHAFTIEGLEKIISEYNHEETIKKVKEFNEKLGMIDDGKASDRIADLIKKLTTKNNFIGD